MLSAKPPVQSPFLPRDRDEFRAESGWEVGTGNWTTSQIDKSPNFYYLTKILIYRKRWKERERERFDVIEKKKIGLK